MPRVRQDGERRRVSQADVARLAGVSPGVVSAVINNRDYGAIRVSDATRERVRDAVRELGYVPNVAARNLARGSNRLIGIFTFEPMFPVRPPNFYHEFLVGIEEAADAAEYNLLLLTGPRDESQRRSIYTGGVNQMQLADGALLMGGSFIDDEVIRLARDRFPFVCIGRREYPDVELSYVAADYFGGTRDLVGEVIGIGHRRIALIVGGPEPERYPARRAGHLRAVTDAGLAAEDCPVYLISDQADEPANEATATIDIRGLIKQCIDGRLTALVVERADMATQIWYELTNAGLRIPEDVSIVGLAGAGIPPSTSPGGDDRLDLTELHLPRYEMGQEGIRLLLERLTHADDVPARVTLPCSVYRGHSVAAPGRP